MEEIKRTDHLVLAWHDDAQSILGITVLSSVKTWDEINSIFELANQTTWKTPHDVFILVHLANNKSMWPQQLALPNIRNLIQDSAPNEKMVILVNCGRFLQMTVDLVKMAYGLQRLMNKYHYVNTLEEAYGLVEKFKQTSA